MAENLATVDQLRAVGAKPSRRFKLLDPLPVSGLRLRIQSLTEREMSQYQAGFLTKETQPKPGRMIDANGRLFVRVIVDAEGNRLLADSEAAMFDGWDAADTVSLYDQVAIHLGIRVQIKERQENSEEVVDAGDVSGRVQ